ncbi:hypothetical protein JKF63_02943 [Porcisia hertigi]|uniref:Protein kinase domain-containing protein n=1 Tax=Porcisia hertigi TaxID=2761500 RepID=A0A836HEP7_9TRYP|nr:hypothetical protein JKF63_02943 [Porcisia hertigi]
MTARETSWNGARLLLATDVAGVIHCYRYTSEKESIDDTDDDEPVAVLTHLWSRSLLDKNVPSNLLTLDDSRTSSLVPRGVANEKPECCAHAGFHCSISEPLRRLQTASIVHALSATTEKADAVGVHRDVSCAAPHDLCFSGLQNGARERGAEIKYGASSQGTREGGNRGCSPASASNQWGQRAFRARCPFCAWAAPPPSSPPVGVALPYLPPTPELSGVSDVPVSPSLTLASGSATLPLYGSSTGDHALAEGRRCGVETELDEASCGGDAVSESLFRPSDFMARIKEATSSVVIDSATLQSGVATNCASAALASPARVCVSSQTADVAWYWRCPQAILDAHTTPEGCDSDAKCSAQREAANKGEAHPLGSVRREKESTDSAEDSTEEHLWMSLPEAVQHWNSICCHRHQLLLLRHMEEQYSELDLFTGASLGSVSLTDAMVSAAATPMDDSTASSGILEHSSHPSIIDGSGIESSSDIVDTVSTATDDEAPRAVLSLTAQRFQTHVMQALVTRFPEKHTKKRHPRRVASVASTRKPNHRCLAKLTAPAVRLGVTWHAPWQKKRKDLCASDTDYDAIKEDVQEEVSVLCALQGPNERPLSSCSSESTSHHNSTSASDIDMDVLTGRKRLPLQHHAVPAANSVLGSSVTTATPPSGISNEAANLSKKKRVRQKCAGADTIAQSSPEHQTESNEIPVRCGPGGCIYSSVAAELDNPTTSTNGEASLPPPPQFFLLLQLPLPLVEAFWVTLPSTLAPCSPPNGGIAVELGRTNHWSTSSVELKQVPWISSDAGSFRVVEASIGGGASTSASLRPASASANFTTLRGFLLEVPEVSSAQGAMFTGFPRVLCTLSAYDLLSARRGAAHRVQLAPGRGENSKSCGASGARRCEKASRAAGVPRVCSDVCSITPGHSFTSSFYEKQRNSGGGVTHSISPPGYHFVPSTSFFDENFEPLTLLGRGVGGAALLVQHRFTGLFYAIKVMVIRDYESERDILQEMRVHAMLENRYVVRYHTCWSEVISATRAQQLAFIGVCHPSEAKVVGHKCLSSAPSSSPATTQLNACGSAWYPRTTSQRDLLGESTLRCAPGGWHHLMLPSHSSMVLVGSDSMSDTATSIRSRPQLRSNAWSTAVLDECTHDTTDDEKDTVVLGEVEKREPEGGDWTRHTGTPKSSLTKTRSLASRRPLSLSLSSSSLWDSAAPLASHQVRKKPLDTSASSSSSFSTVSDNMGGAAAQKDSCNEEKLESIWDDARGVDSDSTSNSNDSHSDTASEYSSRQRQKRNTIIGARVVFLQMELCQMTLAQYLASRASIDRVENLIILLQLVAGLRYLHGRGILHRDMKPTNVFMDYRCQFDKSVHQTNSSSTSGDDDAFENEGHSRSSLQNTASSLPLCGDGDRTSPSSSSFALCRPHAGACLSSFSSPGFGRNVSCVPWRSSTVLPGTQKLLSAPATTSPSSVWGAMAARTSLDTLPSWNGERTALDFVMRPPHRLASEMLHDRLLRQPPPPATRVRAGAKGEVLEGDTPSYTAALSPVVQSSSSRYFFRRLSNWLLHRFVRVRLGDFGLAKFLYQQQLHVDGFVSMNTTNTVGVGSPLYASPEQLKGSRCTAASDAFSVGIVLVEMYIQPKTIAERLTVLREVREGVFHDVILLAQFPEVELARRLTVAQPERRMSLSAFYKALEAFLEEALQDVVYRHYK